MSEEEEEGELPPEEEIKKQIDEAMEKAEKKRKQQATKVKSIKPTQFKTLEKHIDEKAKKKLETEESPCEEE